MPQVSIAWKKRLKKVHGCVLPGIKKLYMIYRGLCVIMVRRQITRYDTAKNLIMNQATREVSPKWEIMIRTFFSSKIIWDNLKQSGSFVESCAIVYIIILVFKFWYNVSPQSTKYNLFLNKPYNGISLIVHIEIYNLILLSAMLLQPVILK